MTFDKKDCPIHIEPEHFEEWVTGSAVSPRITALNVKSLRIPEDIDELLNRNTKNRWGGSWKHGPGWAVTGVDPETGRETWDGAQFKPNQPVQNVVDGIPKFKRNGDPDIKKYFNASNCESAPLFLDTGEPDYWLKVKNDITIRLLVGEGAKKAGSALTAGEAFVSIPGVSNGQRKGRLKKSLERFCESGREIDICFDSDQHFNPNVCRELHKLGCLLKNRGVLVKVLMLPRDTKGVDDFIVKYGAEAFKQLVDQALTFEEWRDEYFLHPTKEVKTPTPDLPEAEENYQLKAQAALFSDRPWVSIDGHLYQWNDTHYQLQNEAVVKRLISNWCKGTATYSSGEWCYKYATATHIDNIYAWVLRDFAVDPSVVNPPGLNCLNGVLKISWNGRTPRWELVRHDPTVVYTYVGEFEFNRNADSQACDRLLQCLDAPQREVFIKTLAASLDLKTIREFKGRAARALLCKGDGNNGKDSLRESVALLYGMGVVNTTVTDFQSYDQGRKFTLAKLEHARISWSSENSSFKQLDSLQSLKAAITGEPIDLERKNQDERQMSLNTVFLFNINDAPNLQASLEAIKSRWAVLSFNKTFKVNADDSKGELEADPRFRYDPNFLKTEVVPALLNKMLAALPEVAMKGIDYSCTDEALEEIREESTHLARFAREVGLGYQVGGRVYINDLWEKLREWYIANGTLVITTDGKGKEKQEWHDQPRRDDKNVKAPNQVYQRFHNLFPKVRRERETFDRERIGQSYLSGLGFGDPSQTRKSLPEGISLASKVIELFNQLSLEDQEVVRKAMNMDNNVIAFDSLGSQNDMASITGSHNGSQTASLPSQAVSVESLSAGSFINTSGSVAYLGSAGDTSISNSTKNFSASPDVYDFKVGDHVRVVNPGSKRHNKVGEITGFKTRKGMKLADVRLPDEQSAYEAQLTWLRPVPIEGEQQKLL